MINVCVLEYGSGNVGSISNLLKYMNIQFTISSNEKCIIDATHLILPGVGAFGAVMDKISSNLPISVLEKEVLFNKKPFLGICVGMQVLADYGLEFNKNKGLGWISGSVEMINSGDNPLPHIGWNDIEIIQASNLVNGLDEVNDFYFVNSYCFNPDDDKSVIATTTYNEKFASIIGKNNILGVQFHPEKSQSAGQRLIKNFLEY